MSNFNKDKLLVHDNTLENHSLQLSELAVTKADKSNLDKLQKNIDSHASKISNVEDKVAKNKENIAANKNAVDNHEKRISRNERILRQQAVVEAETRAAVIANAQGIYQNSEAIKTLNSRVDHLDDKLNKGMALMSAMATVDFQDVNAGEIGIGAGLGHYGNSQGVAVGVAYAPSDDFKINAKYSVSTSDVKTSAVGVGAVYKFKVR